MKIMFLNLPYIFKISRASRWPERTKSGTLYYPYWLAYAAGVCIAKGYDVQLIDCITKNNTVNQAVEYVSQFKPDVLVTEVTTPTAEYDYSTIAQIKKACEDTIIILGGTHVTALPEDALKKCLAADIVVRQEYDFTIPEIVESLHDYSEIKGISYRVGNVIKHNEDRNYLENLDDLPFVSKVYQMYLNPGDYFYAFAKHPMIQLFSARGCPFRCNFCSYPETLSGRRFRKRSITNFVDEIEYIHKHMPYIKEIFIEDDTFTVDRNRVIQICDDILNRGLNIVWSCNTRADLPYEVMKRMHEAGCRLLVVGYESGNQQVLDEIRKGITLDQSIEFAKNTKSIGLKVFGCFMIGLKGDNIDTIEQTYKFAKKILPDMVFFQQAVPFPGTAFYEWVKSFKGLKTEDYSKWLNKDGYLDCLVNYPYATAETIEKLRDQLMSRYYFSFTYIIKTFLKSLNWIEFKRVTRAGFTYIVFRFKKALRNY